MKSNIKQTLKKYLFDFPEPIVKKYIYLSLTDRIYPNTSDFIEFLEETNDDKLINKAKRIVLQFSYENSFFPPAKLIFNLLSTETGEESKETDGIYFHNDHFVHKVNLYLLGLYIFFYHQTIHKNVIDKFRMKRSIINNKTLKLEEVLKDIIEAWKFFVFFHDIGYPIELFVGKEYDSKKSTEIYDKYLYLFDKISLLIEKDVSAKLFTNLIVYNKIKGHQTIKTFQNVVLNYDEELKIFYNKSIISQEEFSAIIKNSVELDKVFGKFSLRLIKSFISFQNIICVLKRKSFEEPLLIVLPDDIKKEKSKVYHTNYCPKWRHSHQNLINSAYNNSPIKGDYYWVYYCKKFINPFIEIENFNEKNFIEVSSVITKNIPIDFDIITSEADFKNFCFEVYYSVNEALKLFKDNYEQLSKLQLFYETREPIFLSVVEDLPEIVSAIFKQKLRESLKETYDESNKSSTNSLDLEKILKESFNHFLGNDDQISELISILNNNIESDIKSKIKVQIDIHQTWKKLREKVLPHINESCISLKKKDKGFELTYNELLVEQKDFIETFEKKLDDNKIGPLKDALNYFPAFMEKENRNGFDHGIISSIIAMDIINIQENILKKPNAKILNYATLNSPEYDIESDISHLKNTLLESLYAIFTHNIYPKDFHKKFKTKLNETPFVYMCILADSLQPWDRKKSIDFAKYNLPYTVVSNQFNIEIKENKFYIYEEGNMINLEARYKALKVYLDDYLSNASTLIRTNIKEI